MEVRATIKHERVCLMEDIIALKEQIRKFFFEKHLDFLTSVPQQRIQEIMAVQLHKGKQQEINRFRRRVPGSQNNLWAFSVKGKMG